MEKDKIKTKCDALLIGGSAGSLDVILTVLPGLHARLSFPVIIILHRKKSPGSHLSELLSHKTILPVTEIEDKEEVKPGHIYLAPPDYHLLIEKEGFFSLDATEKINFSRPSIDLTFDSAAECYGPNTVCILLSGANADGVQGLRAVKMNGGFSVAQDPSTAKVSFMPEQAILNKHVDLILTPGEMADFINGL